MDLTPNPLLSAARPALPHGGDDETRRELLVRPHIRDDRRLRQAAKLDIRDARRAKDAAEVIGELPGEGESVHLLVSGRFALWDCVPAILDIAGEHAERLHIATLGFSKRNVESMARLLDAGRINSLRLLGSHYFRRTSAEIYQFAADELGKRSPRAEFLSVGTHCKLLMVRTPTRTITVESSANLRSCNNMEQVSLCGSLALYAFHTAWMDELFEKGADFVNCYTGEAGGAARRY